MQRGTEGEERRRKNRGEDKKKNVTDRDGQGETGWRMGGDQWQIRYWRQKHGRNWFM